MSTSKILEIYTDGSSLGNPGPGGWGFVVVSNNLIVKEVGGGDKQTTNNKMELKGAIEALKYLTENEFIKCDIYADSSYVLNGVTIWIHGWEKNGWKTANKKPVLNQELWQELVSLDRQLKGKISWNKVKGHSGHIYNDRADEIATAHASKQK
jgi:ribonuclease HI